MRDKTTASVEAIERAIRILDAFSVHQPELGVAEIGRALNLKRSTVHRALVTLETGGLLRQVSASQKYTLGPKVLYLAQIFQSHFSLATIALPAMRDLRDQCSETVALHLADREGRVCVQQVESPHDLRRTYQNIGQALPLYAGSPGKLLMAFMARAEVERIIDETGLKSLTPLTITDRDEFLKELDETRRRGYAISLGEHTTNINSISCPVRDQHGVVVAAVNISGPQVRFTKEKMLECLPPLRDATLTISRQLGYRGTGEAEREKE